MPGGEMQLQSVFYSPQLAEILERFDAAERRDEAIAAALDRIEQKLDLVVLTEVSQMADLTALTQEVSENGDAVQSAVALLGSLSDQIRQLSTDPAALQALADQLDSQTQQLAEAVVANTPAEQPGGGNGEPQPQPGEGDAQPGA